MLLSGLGMADKDYMTGQFVLDNAHFVVIWLSSAPASACLCSSLGIQVYQICVIMHLSHYCHAMPCDADAEEPIAAVSIALKLSGTSHY